MAEKLTNTDVFYAEQAPEVIAKKAGVSVNNVFYAEQDPRKLAKALNVAVDSVFYYKQDPNKLANEYTGGVTPPAPATLVSIAITTPPTKTVHTVGEALDITGMVVTGTYSDDSTKVESVTADNVTGFSSDTAGEKTCTVTVSGKTATFTVTVNEA